MAIHAGGVIIQILASKLGGQPTRADVAAWVNTYHLPITVVRDPDGAGTVTLDTYGVRETCFIVDLATMRVVRRINGSVSGSGQSSIAQIMPEFLRLLGH